jgi:hypothetical protein
VSDVGGNLLRELELTKTPWVEVLRSNRKNLDPIFFGIYGDIVYHHGAGFRGSEFTRVHYSLAPKPGPSPRIPILRQLVGRVNRQKRRAWARRTHRQQVLQSERLFEKIQRGGSDWLSELT